MKNLTRTQVKSLNAWAHPKDSLEALWADRGDGSRDEVVKVTRTRVYFQNDWDDSVWSEPISSIKAFKVLTLVTWLGDSS